MMKIKPEHYQTLRAAILERHSSERQDAYTLAGLSPMRYRWDLLWSTEVEGASANQWVCDVLYKYMNDANIDTALRAILAR